MLHHEEFLSLLGIQIPKTKSRILELLQAEGLITPDVGGRWNILNLGACLLARQLADFPRIARKAIRMIEYEDLSRVHAKKEHTVPRGYAVGFEKLIDRIMELTSTETIGSLRLRAQPFPRPAVRELVANALIHQDMTETGAGPMIELFKDRIEITNPRSAASSSLKNSWTCRPSRATKIWPR